VAVLFDEESSRIEGGTRQTHGARFIVRGTAPLSGWVFLAPGKELRALSLDDDRLDQTCFGFRRALWAFAAKAGTLEFRFS
jgi:hypothetical protein